MSEHQLQRIQFVTTYYDWLQGLRFVPVGLLSLGVAVWLALPGQEADVSAQRTRVRLVLGVGLILATALYALLGAYYRRRFGVVRMSPSTRQRMQRALGVSMGVGLLAGILSALLRASSASLTQGPVSWLLLLAGLSIAWYWHWSGRFAHHYLAVAAGLAGLALLQGVDANPVCALLRTLPFTTDGHCAAVTLSGAVGLAVIGLGVLDHRLLVHTLGSEPEGGEEVPE
jgi:hypothetical protein